MESSDKGYRRIRDDLDRYHGIKVNDKRVLRICRKKGIKSTIKYSNNGCTRQAANPQYIAENPGAKPLCHSDRGFQYTNRIFHAKLEVAGMTQSMSRVAKCIDNGPMEGSWGIRLQRNLGVLTPMEKYEQYLAAA